MFRALPLKTPAGRQRGFSFFEVLVAALILGIGVLGFASLQLRALDSTGSAHFRAQAAVLAAELAERIRMADAGIDVDHTTYEDAALWDGDLPDDAPSTWTRGTDTCMATVLAGAVCDEDALVTSDTQEIRYMASQVLPNGTVSVRPCEAGSDLTCVFVAWRGQTADACEIDAPEAECVAAQVLF